MTSTPTAAKLRVMRGALRWHFALPKLPSMISLLRASVVSFVVQATLPVFWVPAGILFIALLVMMTAELSTKYMGLAPEGRSIFLWEQEITGKFLLLFLVIVSLVFDLTVYLVANRLPQEITLLDQGYLFVTITAELWLFGAQMAQTITNIRTRVGRDLIPPVMNFAVDHIRAILNFIRTTDHERLKRTSEPLTHPPRWYDYLTQDDFHEIQRRIEARRRGEEITTPAEFAADRKEEGEP